MLHIHIQIQSFQTNIQDHFKHIHFISLCVYEPNSSLHFLLYHECPKLIKFILNVNASY